MSNFLSRITRLFSGSRGAAPKAAAQQPHPEETHMTDAAPKPWPAMTLAEAHELMTGAGSPFEMEELDIRGVHQRVWKNSPPTLREVFLAGRAWGDREFLVYKDERVTFAAFDRATLTAAHAMMKLGVKKGDRVVIALRNFPEWPVAFFAAALIGAIVTPLNSWWTGRELRYGLEDSGAVLAIVDGERISRLTKYLGDLPALKHIMVVRGEGDMPDIATDFADVVGPIAGWSALPELPLPDVDLHPDDDATIFYTSGTTGHPKGALGTHRNITTNILSSAFATARSFVRRGEMPPTPSPDDPQRIALLSIPFFHATGCQAILIPSVFGGLELVLMHHWDPIEAMGLIEKEKCSTAGGVPTIAWQLLEHPERDNFDLSSLEVISYGGAPASTELAERIKEAFPKSEPGQGWGMTETSAIFTNHGGEDYRNRPGSAGPAVPICDLKVIGSDGAELATGEIGELLAKGPNVVKEYWNKPEATAETFVDGWLHTGDLAKLDEEGFVTIVDRLKDMLIRGGENIYCIEVENALYEHPAVMDAAVVGIPHHTLGEEPGAVVTLKAGASADEAELKAFARERLASFKVPVRIVFWDGPLPRNPNGKILKNELKPVFVDT